MKIASAARGIFDHQCKTTFATQSSQKRTFMLKGEGAACIVTRSAFDPGTTEKVKLSNYYACAVGRGSQCRSRAKRRGGVNASSPERASPTSSRCLCRSC